jgi:hypothetical protein
MNVFEQDVEGRLGIAANNNQTTMSKTVMAKEKRVKMPLTDP